MAENIVAADLGPENLDTLKTPVIWTYLSPIRP
jgi:hypothetical protein